MDRDTWTNREWPVLAAAADILEEGQSRFADGPSIAERAGLTHQDVAAAVKLLQGEYVIVSTWDRSDGFDNPLVGGITPAGLRAVGQWPSAESVTTRFLEALDVRVEQAPTEEERSRWVKLRDSALGISRDLFVDVMGNVVGRGITG